MTPVTKSYSFSPFHSILVKTYLLEIISSLYSSLAFKFEFNQVFTVLPLHSPVFRHRTLILIQVLESFLTCLPGFLNFETGSCFYCL